MLDTVVGEIKVLLRLPPELHAELVQVAKDETRSVNGQIVHMLRTQLQQRKREAPPQQP